LKGARAAVVTGAQGGIGVALCKAFKEAGYYTVGIDISEADQDICDAAIRADLNAAAEDAERGRRLLDEVRTAVGERDLAVLVNNAAVQILKASDELALAEFRESLNVNLLAPFILSQGLLDLLEASSGAIINIGSIHARLTKPGFVAYATSKAALEGMTRAMAVDLGSKVRVNAIAPAAIETEMLKAGFEGDQGGYDALMECHPVGRIGEVSEVAEAALFLASDRAGFINGSVFSIDGGISARLHDPR